jgi:2-methylcitrate dehydratase PrpD
MGTTEKVAEFVVRTRFEDIPDRAVELAKRAALDCLASALAGCAEPTSQNLMGFARKLEGKPESAVVGGGFRTAALDAALVNGSIANAQDYNDCGVKAGHPSVVVLPAVLALAEKLRAGGKQVLTSYILGLEVQGKVGLRLDYKQAEHPLNNMSFLGSLGAAAAAAKMLNLDVLQTRMAMGIATSLAGGLRANHGTMMAPMMSSGNTNHAGLLAALMAQEGITASPDIIEAKSGLCDTLAGRGRYDLAGLAEELGNPFYVVSPGIGLKTHAVCHHTVRAIGAVLQIMAEHHLTYDDVLEADVGTSQAALHVLAFQEPADSYQARFSMPYVIGCALLDGKVTLESFTEKKRKDPKVIEAGKKVRLSFPDLPIWPGLMDVRPDSNFVGNPVTLRTRDGRSYSGRVDIPRGDPGLPLSDEELLAKFADCAKFTLSSEETSRAGKLTLDLDKLSDVREVMDILMKPGKVEAAAGSAR